MTNGKIIKTIGIAVTVIGFGFNILTDWVNEKKMRHLPNEIAKTKRSPNKGSFFSVWSRCI